MKGLRYGLTVQLVSLTKTVYLGDELTGSAGIRIVMSSDMINCALLVSQPLLEWDTFEHTMQKA